MTAEKRRSILDFYDSCEISMIPKLSNETLAKMMQQIQPVMQVKNNRFRLIDTTKIDPKAESFIWSPKLGRLVQLYNNSMNSKDIMTFHTWAYYGFFKPTLYEVYACINHYIKDWSMIRFFRLCSDEVGRENILGEYHYCRCQVFGPEQTEVHDSAWARDAVELVKDEPEETDE